MNTSSIEATEGARMDLESPKRFISKQLSLSLACLAATIIKSPILKAYLYVTSLRAHLMLRALPTGHLWKNTQLQWSDIATAWGGLASVSNKRVPRKPKRELEQK